MVAIEAMNDTVSKNGLVPTRVIFGSVLYFPTINTELASQKVK